MGISFVSIGPNTIYKNRKNSEAATVQPEKSTIWSRIKRLLNLPSESLGKDSYLLPIILKRNIL